MSALGPDPLRVVHDALEHSDTDPAPATERVDHVDHLPPWTRAVMHGRCRQTWAWPVIDPAIDPPLDCRDTLFCEDCDDGGHPAYGAFVALSKVPQPGVHLPPELARRWSPVPDDLWGNLEDLGLRTNDVVVALAVWRRQLGGRKASCWPSMEDLASLTGLGRTTVKGSVKRLADRGYLTVTPRRRDGRQTSNLLDVRPLWGALERLLLDRAAEAENDGNTSKGSSQRSPGDLSQRSPGDP